jgi:hypothetical protein
MAAAVSAASTLRLVSGPVGLSGASALAGVDPVDGLGAGILPFIGFIQPQAGRPRKLCRGRDTRSIAQSRRYGLALPTVTGASQHDATSAVISATGGTE